MVNVQGEQLESLMFLQEDDDVHQPGGTKIQQAARWPSEPAWGGASSAEGPWRRIRGQGVEQEPGWRC